MLKLIRKRKSAKFALSGWLLACCSKKKKSLQQIADDRCAKHIDLVNLIRSQMIDTVTRRLQFTKLDRYLIRN